MFWQRRADDDEECRYVVTDVSGSAMGIRQQRPFGVRAAVTLASVSAAVGAAAAAALLGATGLVQRAPADLTEPLVLPSLAPLSRESEELARRTEYLFGELSAHEARVVARFAAEKLGCKTRVLGPDDLRGCLLMGSEAVSLRMPAKAAALAHLDEGAPAPPRTAQVIVVHGDKPREEGVGIYSVGPLDGDGGLAQDATIRLEQSVHFNRRPLDQGDNSVNFLIRKVLEQHKDLLVGSFGAIFQQLPDAWQREAGMTWVLMSPAVSSTVEQRVSRVVFNWFKDPNQFEISWMHTIPYNFDVIHDGEPEEWLAVNVSYCGQTFPTPEALVQADAAGTLQRCSSRPGTAYGWDVAGPDPGTPASFAVPPPRPRVRRSWHVLGRGGIRWGDWEFFATVRPGSGPAIHDVRWRGERILYELALSDAHAYYSSAHAEKQFHYSDKAFSLSQLSGDLVPGLDCPLGATLLEGLSWMFTDRETGATVTDPTYAQPLKLACVFESSGADGSLWRHAQLYSRQVAGRRLRMLVVRHVSTVGNYDYISEVYFMEDGQIHVRNEFAGYPETDKTAPFHDPLARVRKTSENDGGERSVIDWGSHVRGDLVAQLHSHFCVWKVDLDIFGVSNEFHTVKSVVRPGTAGSLPAKSQAVRRVEQEDPEETFVASAATPGVWRIVNPKAENPVTATPRGYAVVIESAPALQTLPRDHPFSVTGTFARRHLAVTQRKDEEPHATHSLDHYPITDPLLSVERFLGDREPLLGTDLVCWVSIGKEHITRAEDVPLVSNFGVQFALVPWNYHEENAGMQLPMSKGPKAPDAVAHGRP